MTRGAPAWAPMTCQLVEELSVEQCAIYNTLTHTGTHRNKNMDKYAMFTFYIAKLLIN